MLNERQKRLYEISSVDGMIVGNIETAEYPYEDNYEYLTGLCYLPGELVLAMEESGFEVIEDEEQKKYARADTAEEEIEEDREETDLRTYDMAYFQETRKRSGMNFQINLYLI